MKEYVRIDIAESFVCLGGKCPYTCCKGWQIPVDDDTYAGYEKLPGIKGKLFRLGIKKGEIKLIRKVCFVCPFFSKERLCRHQRDGHMELMPLVCQNYPRRVVDTGEYCETTLELSCPEAARIFLDNPGRRRFVKGPEIKPLWDLENDDLDFLSFLKGDREKILDYTWSDKPLYTVWEDLYAYIYAQHDFLTRDKLSEAKKVELTGDKKLQGDYALYTGRHYAFFPISTIDRMLLEHIDHGLLVVRVPAFYRLFQYYLKIFSKKTIVEADRYFNDKLEEMMEARPGMEEKYRSYFSYVIQQEYLLCYENYSLIREYLLCVLYTQLLMLFDLVEYIKGKLDSTRECEILYLAEHNIRHNPYLRKELFDVIRSEFF